MIQVRRILCPTDLSNESDEALRYAVALARIYEAKLFLLHCSEQDSFPEEKDEEKLKTQMDRLFVAVIGTLITLIVLQTLAVAWVHCFGIHLLEFIVFDIQTRHTMSLSSRSG